MRVQAQAAECACGCAHAQAVLTGLTTMEPVMVAGVG